MSAQEQANKQNGSKGNGPNSAELVPVGSQKNSLEQPDPRATGPRTLRGKEKSKMNAVKHGIFAHVVLSGRRARESKAQYQRLLADLQESLQPEGALEEILVEKLTTTLWRYRRLLRAEAAEIEKGAERAEWDTKNQEQREIDELNRNPSERSQGLIRQIHNPTVLHRCIALLSELQASIDRYGADSDNDLETLKIIYGDNDNVRESLYQTYLEWMRTAAVSVEERDREGYPTAQQCMHYIREAIDEEIHRLKAYERHQMAIAATRARLDMIRQSVPDTPGWERLLRYEASLERSFDRTLAQLGRLQRMRLGHSVPPTLKVDVTNR